MSVQVTQLVIKILQLRAFVFHLSFHFHLVTHIPIRCWTCVENALGYTTFQIKFRFMVFLCFAETGYCWPRNYRNLLF